MSYLLDTCVLSEFTRRAPSEQVTAWLASIPQDQLFLSVLSLGELQRGIERLPETARKNKLRSWLENELLPRFGQNLLPIDDQCMLIWGTMLARLESAGRPMPLMDSLIAASGLRYSLVVATRNVEDFSSSGVRVFNPWQAVESG